MPNRQRVKVCFNDECRVYVPIHLNNIESMREEKRFDILHKGHVVQIVNLDELEPKRRFDPTYICVSGIAIEKAKNELDNTFNK